MKISVITWDASFRESYHFLDFITNQSFEESDYEIIWVEFYSNSNSLLQKKIKDKENLKLLELKNDSQKQWHLGECMNAGIENSTGDVLVFPDGDIAVGYNFLKIIYESIEIKKEADVVYLRRWDEPKHKHNDPLSYSIEYLEKECMLGNLTNYGGCMATTREKFNFIGNYTTHPIFSGAGSIGFDIYLRFRNANYGIKWLEEKIFHPYHGGTLGSSNSEKKRLKLEFYRFVYKWFDFDFLEQQWVLKKRNSDLYFLSDDKRINDYLLDLPQDHKSIRMRILYKVYTLASRLILK